MADLTIHSYEGQDSRVVLVLRGELDIASAPALAHAMTGVLDRGAPSLLLDVAALEFVDSTGLRAILAARALCAERSCEFALTPPTRSVKRLFEVTGLLEELPYQELERGRTAQLVDLWPRRNGGSDTPDSGREGADGSRGAFEGHQNSHP